MSDNDFKAAAVYARAHFEAKLKRFCDRNGLKVRYKEKAADLKSEDFWQALEEAANSQHWPQLTDQLLADVKKYRKIILNPLSHADWSSVYRLEVEKAIKVIEQLEAALDSITSRRAKEQKSNAY